MKKPKRIFQYLTKELEGKIEFELSKNSHYENKEYKEGFIFCITHNFSIESGISILNELYKIYPSPDRFLANIEKLSIEEIQKMFREIIEFQFNKIKNELKEPQIIAIDFNDLEYYGKDNPMIIRSKAKNGTDKFYRFATVKIANNENGLTLAILQVSPFDSKEMIVLKLIEEVMKKIKIKLLLLDRGFYSVKVVNLLNSLNVPFLMPIPKNKGVKKFIIVMVNSEERIREYEMSSMHKKAKFNFVLTKSEKIALSLEEKFNGFATNLNLSLEEIVEIVKEYKKRWIIETSYRVKDDFMIRTTSVNYKVRLFVYLFSFICMNFWLMFNLKTGRHYTTILFRFLIIYETIFSVVVNAVIGLLVKEVGHA